MRAVIYTLILFFAIFDNLYASKDARMVPKDTILS